MDRARATLVVVTALTAVPTFAACGDLADDQTQPQALATIYGKLTTSSAPTSKGRIAMAVFWDEKSYAAGIVAPIDVVIESNDPETCTERDTDKQYTDGTPWESRTICKSRQSHTRELAETVSYEPEFPLSFKIPVRRVPPKAARVNLGSFGGSGTFAMGSVVGFVDADRDKEFDFGKVGKAPEEVVAMSIGTPIGNDGTIASDWVIYLDGEINLENVFEGYRDTLAAIPQGFSVWHTVTKPNTDPNAPPVRIREILPISEPIALNGDPTLKDSQAFCREARFELRYTAEEFEPEVGYWYCTEEGLDYEARRPLSQVAPCSYRAQYFRRNITDLAESDIPSDWPCELD